MDGLLGLIIAAFVIMTILPLLAYALLAFCCYAALGFVRTCDFFNSLNTKYQLYKRRI